MNPALRALAFLSAVLLCVPFIATVQAFPRAVNSSDALPPRPYSRQQLIKLLIGLHPPQPYPGLTLATPPPSNVTGLAGDRCATHTSCHPSLWCDFGTCVSAPASRHAHNCTSSADCHPAEFCHWRTIYGVKSGICTSSHAYQHRPLFILHEPLAKQPPRRGGTTGDLCILHSDCEGSRSCRGISLHGNITGCELASSPCVCVPSEFTVCVSATADQQACPKFSNEICQTIQLPSSKRQLQPLCLTRTLLQSDRVSNLTSPRAFASFVALQQNANRPSTRRPPPVNENRPSFSVPALSTFESFTTDDLTNDFICDIASLIILICIANLVRGSMYAFSGIRKSRYNMYIIFSRLSRMRNLFQLLSAREQGVWAQLRSRSRTAVKRNYKALFLPLLAVAVLYTGEIGAIVAGTEVRTAFKSDNAFDPRIALVHPLRPPVHRRQDSDNPNCDDFFVAQRGLRRSGKVLKCVEENASPECQPYRQVVQLSVRFGSGKITFQVHSADGACAELDLSIILRSIQGIEGRAMAFRPDLMSDGDTRVLLNGIMNRVRAQLRSAEIGVKSDVWSLQEYRGSNGRLVEIEMYHKHELPHGVKVLKEKLNETLREMDLVLNSTGAPWVFYAPYEFRKNAELVMATSKRPYISHGALVIAAVLIMVAHAILNTMLTYFDEVAYVAMKEIIGDDCVLGPLASNGRTETTTVSYEELVGADDSESGVKGESSTSSGADSTADDDGDSEEQQC